MSTFHRPIGLPLVSSPLASSQGLFGPGFTGDPVDTKSDELSDRRAGGPNEDDWLT
jgi:hypothetical protein